MTPDKIYVSRNFSEDNSPHGLWYLNKSEHDANVEYIRKDALIEWFNDNIKSLNVLFGEIFIARIKDKLNSM